MGGNVGSASGPVLAAFIAVPRGQASLVWFWAVAVLVALLFSKNLYTASMSACIPFWLMDRFALPVQAAQLMLFVLLVAVVLGTLPGGMIGDRVGRVPMMWFSILGPPPFTLALPHSGNPRTQPASRRSGASAPRCRGSGCSPCSCRACPARAGASAPAAARPHSCGQSQETAA